MLNRGTIALHSLQRPVTIDEMRSLQLQILREVAQFCKKWGVRYCLCGGTLLGAIRHKGYIPWDDDIDILMPRKDYLAFLDSASGRLGDNIVVSSQYDNPDHVYPFAKVYDDRTILIEPGNPAIGVGIDIFPMDGLPDAIRESDIIFRKAKTLLTLVDAARIGVARRGKLWKTMLKYPLHLICRCIGHRLFLRQLDGVARGYDFEASNFVAVIVAGNYGRRERIARSAFDTYEKAIFENENFYIPAGWHEYLSNLYGDYMTPPPQRERSGWHVYDCYWK